MKRKEQQGVINEYQLALISRSVFDIGPRCRVIIFMFGLLGLTMAFTASLVSKQNVPLDKIIHFTGYFVLSATFVLALRPAFFIPGLLCLVGLSVAIEFLQRYTGRSFDVRDMAANASGVAAGGMTGIMIRGIFAYLSKELASRKAQQRIIRYPKDHVILREGEPVQDMLILRRGRVRAMRNINGREVEIGQLGAGDVLGVLGVIEQQPQYSTLRTMEPTEVYRMDLDQLMESAGGSELPVSVVLNSLCGKIRILADHLSRSGIRIPYDRTMG